MPSASATHEKTEVRCPKKHGRTKCNKVILKDGAFLCDRCDKETSLVELQAMRLLNGETTHAQFMRELEEELPLDQDPPAHDRAREIMGDNFVSIIEASAVSYTRSPNFDEYLELLPIPFSDELLESVAETHALIPIIQNPSFPGLPFLHGLCPCHDQWRNCKVAKEKLTPQRWLLIHLNPMNTLFSVQGWHEQNGAGLMASEKSGKSDEYVPTAAELVYLEYMLRRTRDKGLVPRIENLWCRPLISNVGDFLENNYEYPMLTQCENNQVALTVAPPSFRGRARLITARHPDLKI